MAKNIRKAVLLLAMLSVIVGMFTACSNKKSDDGRTTFTVGFDAEFPPYGYKDDSGEYVGFDLDLAQEVCEEMAGIWLSSLLTGILKIWSLVQALLTVYGTVSRLMEENVSIHGLRHILIIHRLL